ncbi:MAG: hypothetical protein JRH20_05405 [Deltaproteobacteria bacterium]|nr:hypothetical protein [Deltaproteobacteria bacterium]
MKVRQQNLVLADDSGQAMAEYAIVVAGLMGGLLFLGFQIIPEFIRAFQRYHDSYYLILSMPWG